MSIKATLSQDKSSLTIHVNGRFDFNLHKDFRDLYSSYNSENTIKEYIVDLTDTKYMDSSALGMLLLLREYAGGDGGNIHISGCNAEITEILEISNFDRLFKIDK
ncbi:MAG: STAS domain-containing protein [Gammaproteobacteria bacterium]|nr:STAS domain-containing protein [Gammaproteobacteria bacterium]